MRLYVTHCGELVIQKAKSGLGSIAGQQEEGPRGFPSYVGDIFRSNDDVLMVTVQKLNGTSTIYQKIKRSTHDQTGRQEK